MNPTRPIYLLLLLLVSCSPRIYPLQQADSVRVEYRERLVLDTTYVEIPREAEKIVTPDTVSRLENTYSRSEASVKGGFLHHSLETKPQKVSVPVVVAVRDTVYIKKAAEAIIREVEKPLTGWQRFRLDAFWVLASLVLGFIALKVALWLK